MPGKIEKDHWHPGFLGAMEIEFRSYRKHLDFDDEHTLSKEPLKMDLLVIKRTEVLRLQIRSEIFSGGTTSWNIIRRMME